MNQQELLEQLKSLLNSSEKAIFEIQNGTNIDFYSALIQNNSIECFNLSKLLAPIKSDSVATGTAIEDTKPIEPIVDETPSIPETPIVKTVQPIEVLAEPVIEPVQETIQPEPIKTIETVKEEVKVEPAIEKVTDVPNIEKIQAPKPIAIKEESHEDEISLNEKLSKNKTPVLNFADKSTETAIADLSKAISIGKKFEFINGLFAGNSEVYKNSIQTLQNAENFEAAINYIENEITSKFDWNDSENENLAAEFFALIKRRFN